MSVVMFMVNNGYSMVYPFYGISTVYHGAIMVYPLSVDVARYSVCDVTTIISVDSGVMP